MDTERFTLTGAEFRDLPGWWKITGRIQGKSGNFRGWTVVRKPDGTYWEVAGLHTFPPSSGTVRIDLGDQIVDEETIARCEAYYSQLQQKITQQRAE